MGVIFSKISERIFELLKGQGYQLLMYDNFGDRVYDPTQAYMFFSKENKLMVNLIDDNDDSTIRVNISKTQDLDKIKNLLTQLRLTASHYGLLFSVQKYTKELEPKDFALLATPKIEEQKEFKGDGIVGHKKYFASLVEKELVDPEVARWAQIFVNLDKLTSAGLDQFRGLQDQGDEQKRKDITKQDEYVEQAERWVNNEIGSGNLNKLHAPDKSEVHNRSKEEMLYNYASDIVRALPIDDTILANIIMRVADQFEKIIVGDKPDTWFNSNTRNKLEGLIAITGKKLNLPMPQMESLMEDWEDRMDQFSKDYESFMANWDTNDCVNEILNQYVGYEYLDEIPEDKKEEAQDTVINELSGNSLEIIIGEYISNTFGEEDVPYAADVLDDVKTEIKSRGFEVEETNESALESIKVFENWIDSFDPDKLFENIRKEQNKKKKQLAEQIRKTKKKLLEAKKNKVLVERKLLRENKERLFELAHKFAENKDNSFELKKLAEGLSKEQISDIYNVVSDVWEDSVVRTIKENFKPVSKKKIIKEDNNVRYLLKLSGLNESIDDLEWDDEEIDHDWVDNAARNGLPKAADNDSEFKNWRSNFNDKETTQQILNDDELDEHWTSNEQVMDVQGNEWHMHLESIGDVYRITQYDRSMQEVIDIVECDKDKITHNAAQIEHYLQEYANNSDAFADLREFVENCLYIGPSNNEQILDAEDPSLGLAYDRYSYEEDSMGNITIHDIDTGKDVYLQGDDALELMGQIAMYNLDLPGNEKRLQDVLAQYEYVMEEPDEDVLNSDEEQLNEIGDTEQGRARLQSYIDKAKPNAAGYGLKLTPDNFQKANRRSRGIYSANKRIEDNTPLDYEPTVHDMTMYSDGEVYDITQTDENIKDGDVFKLDGGRTAILMRAWPVMVKGDSHALHSLKEPGKWPLRYKKSAEIANNLGEEVLDETNLNEDWGSSDWSALINYMRQDIDYGSSIEDAARSAAEFYYDHMGYEHPDDAYDSIIRMWYIRNPDRPDDGSKDGGDWMHGDF